MSINFKFIASLALSGLATIHATFAQAGFFDELKTAVADGLDTPKQNLKAYASVEDKQLVDAFYFISDDGAEQGVARDIFAVRKYKFVKITFGSLTFSDLFKKQSMVSIIRDMESYSFSPLDIFGKKYVALANARGNQIKQYSPKLSGVLNTMLKQDFMFKPAPNVATWIAADNVLAEYKPDGELVSLLTRSHQAVDQLGATSDQYIHFYFGKDLMRLVENQVPRQVFEDSFQRVVSLNEQAQAGTSPATPASPSAASVSVMQPESTVSPSQIARIQALQQLSDLRKSGALTDDEFAKEKSKILSN